MYTECTNDSDYQAGGIMVEELRASVRTLRIAVVTETYPPEINGVALTVERFVRGLRLRGHDVQLIRPRQIKNEQAGSTEVLMRGMPIPRYPHLKLGLPAKNQLVRLWSQSRPDIVHIVTEGPLGWSALRAARKCRLPVTSDFRTNFHAYSGHYGLGWLKRPIFAYLRKFHNETRCTMVPTIDLMRDLAQVGFKNLRVVSRGVDTALFTPSRRDERLRRSWGADPDTPVLLYVGRLAAEKNLGALIQAYRAVRTIRPDAILVLVGDGPARAELERCVPDAVFAGVRRNEDLATHYASADLFLFPSITETFGNVTPEAMASGLGVVAYNYAAAAQLISDGVSGRLVPYDQTDAFVSAAVSVVREWPASRDLGFAARHTAEAMGWERQISELENVLIAASAAGRPELSTSSPLMPALTERPIGG